MECTIQEIIRGLRNKLLQECDWTQLNDSDLTPESKQHWTVYRQTLRDLPATQAIAEFTDLSQVVFPNKPE